MALASLPMTDRPPEEAIVVACPHCGQPTRSLKSYRLFDYLVFLFVAFSLQTSQHTACPPCMRKSLALRTILNLVPANVAWPMILLLHGAYFLVSYTNGHSRAVLKILRGQG